MPVTMKELGLDALSPEDRRALAQELLDSVADDRPPSRLSDEQRTELRSRCAELDADPSIAITREELWARVRARR